MDSNALLADLTNLQFVQAAVLCIQKCPINSRKALQGCDAQSLLQEGLEETWPHLQERELTARE